MKCKIEVIIGVLLIISVVSCDYIENLYRDGVPMTRQIHITDYTTIDVKASVKLVFVNGTADSIYLSGPDFNVTKIICEQEGELLTIDAKESNFSRKDQLVEVGLPVNSLHKIRLDVPTVIDCKEQLKLNNFMLMVDGSAAYSESVLDVDANKLTVVVYGSNVGKHVIKGAARQMNVTAEGISVVDARNLLCERVSVNQRSENDLFFSAKSSLSVNMCSSGNVYYSGKPEISFKTTNPGWEVDYGEVLPF